MNHPEWESENSLTCPADRDREVRWRPTQNAPALQDSELVNAMKELNNEAFTRKFPKVERTYADPAIPLQFIGLISFTPAKGAKPNENGVYGFAKLRGNYATALEAEQRAEYLIRNIDSYHQIYHTYVGRPFPITTSSKYSEQTDEVDIRKEMVQSVSNSVKEKKMSEQREAQSMKEREEALLAESRMDPSEVDPYEEYITLRVKKAQLSWTYLEHMNKMKEVKEIILKTREQVDEMDKTNPEFKDKYYDKYMKARRDAGLKDTDESNQSNFIKFMVEDAVLPGIDS